MIKWIRPRQGGNLFPERLTNGAAEVYENEIVSLEHEVVISATAASDYLHGVSAQRAAAAAEIRVIQATPDMEIAITYAGGTPVIHQEYGVSVASHVFTLDVTNVAKPLLHVQKLETLPDGTAVAICTFIPTKCTPWYVKATT
ncbi:MAG: hypothetical protein ACYDCO_01780 [Armatimonadota bacterium]